RHRPHPPDPGPSRGAPPPARGRCGVRRARVGRPPADAPRLEASVAPSPDREGDELRGGAAARLRDLLELGRMKRGLLIVVSGPSGVGKDTLIKRLLEVDPKLVYSVSGTTRKPRPGEKPDQNYTFLSREKFLELADRGSFLEHATYNGQLYGTFRDRVEKARDEGRDVVLKIDVQGAEQVRRVMPDAILIFVVAPSERELRQRQEKRGSESAEDLASRRRIAEREMTQASHYDHVVTNDDVERAAAEILDLIRRARASQT